MLMTDNPKHAETQRALRTAQPTRGIVLTATEDIKQGTLAEVSLKDRTISNTPKERE